MAGEQRYITVDYPDVLELLNGKQNLWLPFETRLKPSINPRQAIPWPYSRAYNKACFSASAQMNRGNLLPFNRQRGAR